MDWLAANWVYVVSVGIPVLIAIINAVTKHYTSSAGLTKALLFAIDVLDIIRPLFAPSDPPRTLKIGVRGERLDK